MAVGLLDLPDGRGGEMDIEVLMADDGWPPLRQSASNDRTDLHFCAGGRVSIVGNDCEIVQAAVAAEVATRAANQRDAASS